MTFCYDTSFHLFEKFNLTIYPGEKVGIIGPTGSGKSTLFKLLLNLMQPQHGKILFNNQDIKTFSNDGIRECITFIPQDPSLFQRSIFDNILYGRPNAKKEEVFHAAKVAQCSHFIESLPNGYQFVVGDKGQKLSGGQRQLIAVARAILKNTNLWLIDEATSSLDVENEFQLHTALSTILSDKTVLVIAHRLSTLRHVDRIIKIENGKITADGPPSEILNHIPFPSIHDDRVNLF
jgi:ATP-binding cassette subfamily B protein